VGDEGIHCRDVWNALEICVTVKDVNLDRIADLDFWWVGEREGYAAPGRVTRYEFEQQHHFTHIKSFQELISIVQNTILHSPPLKSSIDDAPHIGAMESFTS
jgi:hypothetical protein